MEFKFRAVDDRPAPTFFTPPPNAGENFTFFTEQALRAGYSASTEFRRNDLFQNPAEMQEAIQRELEKQRIREEIIATEIARRRMLEAEVRRDMLIERELVLRRVDGFSIFPAAAPSSVVPMRFDSRFPMLSPPPLQTLPHLECGGSLEERIGRMLEEKRFGGRPMEERVPFQGIREFGNFSFQITPFQRTLEEHVKAPELKSLPEANKEKLIFLAKTGPTLSGTKRKAVTPPALGPGELTSAGSKKPKEEWSCALCQVSATSKRALDEHLQGKKHKSKEAGLIAQKVGKKFGAAPLPRKHVKRTKPADAAGISKLEQGVKPEGESLQVNITEGTKVPKPTTAEDSKKKKHEPLMPKKAEAEAKKKNRKVGVQNSPKNKKKFKFWCEMCQIGAHAEKVMTAHKQGKKHMTRVQEHGQDGGVVSAPTILALPDSTKKENSGVVSAPTILALPDSTKKENDAVVPAPTILALPDSAKMENDAGVAKEVNEETNENADADVDGLVSSSPAS